MVASTGVDPLIGAVCGSFKIVKAIGRGGMGSVYLGEHTVIGSRVAIKVLHERLAADENLVARFYAEARAVNLIGHENIVNIFDMNVVPPNRYYLVMEYLEGNPLNHLLTKPVPPDIAIPILVQVCDALSAAHKAGIIHRDLKPENIFLIKRGRTERFVKVLDFGLAKLLDHTVANQQTAAGLIVGTPEFMSPEQANSTPVDGRADIYSLGCITWLLATARLPFTQRGLTDLLVAHRQMMPPPPHTVNPAMPRAWSDVIMKAIQKRPEDRYQDAAQFGEALDGVLTGKTVPFEPRVSAPATSAAKPGPAAPARPGSSPPARPQPTASPPKPAGPAASAPPRAPPLGEAPPPAQVAAYKRHPAKFDAVVTMLDGTNFGKLPCQDISRGGMFLCCESKMPALFSRVKISIPIGKLDLLAEVVRHVAPDQANAWGMSPGFGVQFVDLTPALRDALHHIIQKLPDEEQAPPVSAPSGVDDGKVEKLLGEYRARVNGGHYEMLGVGLEADFPELKAKARDAQSELEALKGRALPEAQHAQLDAALARVKTAIDVLATPHTRAEYDANRQNHKGVARCIAAGLSSLDLERLRGTFLEAHPGASGSAFVKFLASKAYESKGQTREALEACEAALRLDPLNLQFQQRFQQLTRPARPARRP